MSSVIGNRLGPYVAVLEQNVLEGEEHLQNLWDTSKSKGWEGLILRKDATYNGQR
jgi:ATP-dependent DNA ligase